jgi:dynamin 1-like protein
MLSNCSELTQLCSLYSQYINTSHPDFIGGARAVAAVTNRQANLEARRTAELPAGGSAETPVSTANSNYFNTDDDDEGEPTPYNGNNGGGIMSFIFRGKNTPLQDRSKPGGPPTVVHLPSVPANMKQTDVPPTDRELSEMHVIKSLIESYFKVVRKTFIDMVPKTIMFFLVNHVKDAMQNELVSELYREAEVTSLMKEAEDVAQRRQNCEEMKDLLGKALEIVNEVRDFNTFSQVE